MCAYARKREGMFVCTCEGVCVCVCAAENVCAIENVGGCMCKRERERESVCVCVCARENVCVGACLRV